MTAKIKVFEMNDFTEWWAGESLEACCAEAKKETGVDYPQEGYGIELTDEAMQSMKFCEEDGTTRTFAEQLAKEIADGTKFPCLFAATDS